MSNRIVISTGDPAGCGPLITLKALANLRLPKAKYILVGDKKILDTIAVPLKTYRNIELVDAGTKGIAKIKKGRLSTLAGEASLSYIKEALKLIKRERIFALVTAPVSKEAVQRILPGFVGHTEYCAQFFRVKKFCMLMASDALRVVLLTRHIPLREVSPYLSLKVIKETAELVYIFLREKYKIAHPKIAVASVNPHAGIDTFLEKEERVIVRAIRLCKNKIYGPYPSDTLFVPERLKQFHCILCAYHDQGMIPFKLLSFKSGVNITLGLPIIRTSPAHGVAFDAVREKRHLIYTSMEEAIRCAYRLAYEKK